MYQSVPQPSNYLSTHLKLRATAAGRMSLSGSLILVDTLKTSGRATDILSFTHARTHAHTHNAPSGIRTQDIRQNTPFSLKIFHQNNKQKDHTDRATVCTSSTCWPKGRTNWVTLAWRIMLECMLKKWVEGYGLNSYGLERRPVPD